MKNLEVLKLAVEVMKAHNVTCGYETFVDIKLDEDSENITFLMEFQFMEEVIRITSLLNLSFHRVSLLGKMTNFKIT